MSPPSTHILPPATVVPVNWRATGASFSGRHTGAGCSLRGGICNASPTPVDAVWLGCVAPPIAKIVLSTAATASPCRPVGNGGRSDHVLDAMS